jgi:hypothetical protein
MTEKFQHMLKLHIQLTQEVIMTFNYSRKLDVFGFIDS